jgi:hypothetical protein
MFDRLSRHVGDFALVYFYKSIQLQWLISGVRTWQISGGGRERITSGGI